MGPIGLSNIVKCGMAAAVVKRGFDIHSDFENVIERPTVIKQLQKCYDDILRKEHHSRGKFGEFGSLFKWGQSTTMYDANVCRNIITHGRADLKGNLSKAGQNK